MDPTTAAADPLDTPPTPPATPPPVDDDIWGDSDGEFLPPSTSSYPVNSSISSSDPSTPSQDSATPGKQDLSNPNTSADLLKLRQTHITLGYRDGIAAAKGLFLQDGFDEGYPLGGRIGLRIGWILGVLQSLLRCWPEDEAVKKMLREAEMALDVGKVFGKEWWEGDGTWKWEVEKGDTATLDDVVDAFPVLKGWEERVKGLVREKGLELKHTGEIEVVKERVRQTEELEGVGERLKEVQI
ncbi:hypothetical protein BZA77DRAFT_62975 [Pyronema omphalodes]|nr:hypothetical protein BZA77DRAFT_62975 [Pyronema omphalodes]